MKKIVTFIFYLTTFHLYSQVDKGSDMELKFLASWEFTQLDFEGNYNIYKYMGIGFGIGLQSDFNKSYGGYLLKDRNISWNIEDDYAKMSNLILRPSIRLRSPYWKVRSNQFAIYATPGLIIHPLDRSVIKVNYQKTYPDNQVKSWTNSYNSTFRLARMYGSLQCGIEYLIDDIAIIGGWELSNQDFYASSRNLKFEGVTLNDHLPKRKSLTHGIFIGLRYYP